MKKQIISALAVTSLLAGCADNEEGQRYNPDALNDNNNVQPTRFGGEDGNQLEERNYTMERGMERNFDRNNNNNRNNNFINTRNRENTNGQADRYDVAEEAAEQISNNVEEIDRAYVLTTDNNAYVAAQLDVNERNNGNGNVKNNNNRGDDLTDEVKEEIADIVKSVDNDIDNVYVSTNPDFMDLTNNYVRDANNGEPVEGFFDQMGNMIERLFPQNR
ncbi:YhcN/YlaJ family sporulation lipoprotein [Ornithinibacillus halophilus]|uniref:Sporulation lipoprotein, YhcN/YlaJ family n=1 Tax=Ornithinibacillus halophilus TaxID=930117 RepID=A0A1M5HXW8_9BACI|nr:YhcN/YlaJ family sporulation lipoprotein [Ornithinibacillus halophilus]SHG20737.1 sporulation lipoprotein, YhcN/YlaJ family [Ornithinibacillus halophilus]